MVAEKVQDGLKAFFLSPLSPEDFNEISEYINVSPRDNN